MKETLAQRKLELNSQNMLNSIKNRRRSTQTLVASSQGMRHSGDLYDQVSVDIDLDELETEQNSLNYDTEIITVMETTKGEYPSVDLSIDIQ